MSLRPTLLILALAALTAWACDINLVLSVDKQVCVTEDLLGAQNVTCSWKFDSSNIALINPDSTVCWFNSYGHLVKMSHSSPVLRGESIERYYTMQHLVNLRSDKRCSSSGNCPSSASGYKQAHGKLNCQGNCDNSWTGKYLSFEERRKDCSGGLSTCSGCASSKCQWCSMNAYPSGSMFRVDRFKWIYDDTQTITVCVGNCVTCLFAPGTNCNGIVFTNLVTSMPEKPIFDRCNMIVEFSGANKTVRFFEANKIGETDRSKVGILKYKSVSDPGAFGLFSNSGLGYKDGLYETFQTFDQIMLATLGYYDCNNYRADPLIDRASLRENLTECSSLKLKVIDGPTPQMTPHVSVVPKSSVAVGFFSESVVTSSIIISVKLSSCSVYCEGMELAYGNILCNLTYINTGSSGTAAIRSRNSTELLKTIIIGTEGYTLFQWTIYENHDLEVVTFASSIECITVWNISRYLQTRPPAITGEPVVPQEGDSDASRSILDIFAWPEADWFDVTTGVIAYLLMLVALGAFIFTVLKVILPLYERSTRPNSTRRANETIELSKLELSKAMSLQ